MKLKTEQSRRAFMSTIAAGTAAGLSLMTNPLQASISPDLFQTTKVEGAEELAAKIKAVGKLAHPVAYDVSQANWWGFIWSNVYYLTNQETGTEPAKLGVINVLRHHGIFFSFNDETIKKYNLGEVFGYKDPKTGAFAERNPLYDPEEGVMPMPILKGVKGLHEMGTLYCVCNMAYKVYSGAVATKMGLDPEAVYNDFVKGKHPGLNLAPSGVWVLGRMAENGIAYIDSSVG